MDQTIREHQTRSWRGVRRLAMAAIPLGLIAMVPAHTSAATGAVQRPPLVFPATLTFNHVTAAPAQGCEKTVYRSAITNLRTGVVEGYGVGMVLACDEASAPTEAQSHTIFSNIGAPPATAEPTSATPSSVSPLVIGTFRGSWNPNCGYNQQAVASCGHYCRGFGRRCFRRVR